MDKVTLDRIQLLHPKLREEANSIYEEICKALTGRAMCRFTFTLRTFAEQDALYAQGRTKPGPIVTKAQGGLSLHNYGLAIDIALILDGKEASWDEKKDFDGWEWGGDWKFTDTPHFQKTFGKSVRELLALYKDKKVDKNNYVLI
jgi:peptidoglycan L-alanyl-D-glutamate endopeptidase CwlK